MAGKVPEGYIYDFHYTVFDHIDLVDWGILAANFNVILTASLIGPLLSFSLDLLLVEGIHKTEVNYGHEFWKQSVALGLAGLFGGYNSYFAADDTTLYMKACGSKAAMWIMCGLLFGVASVPQATPLVTQLMPNLLPAVLFVFEGIAILRSCLVSDFPLMNPVEYLVCLITCIVCVTTGVINGESIALAHDAHNAHLYTAVPMPS